MKMLLVSAALHLAQIALAIHKARVLAASK